MYEDIAASFVPGNGTTLEQHTYAFAWTVTAAQTTEGQSAESHQVRLKQVDLDGTDVFLGCHRRSKNRRSDHVGDRRIRCPQASDWNRIIPTRSTRPPPSGIRLPGMQAWCGWRCTTALGQEVEILVDGRQDAGIHEAQFVPGRTEAAASGVYYYRLVAGTEA